MCVADFCRAFGWCPNRASTGLGRGELLSRFSHASPLAVFERLVLATLRAAGIDVGPGDPWNSGHRQRELERAALLTEPDPLTQVADADTQGVEQPSVEAVASFPLLPQVAIWVGACPLAAA